MNRTALAGLLALVSWSAQAGPNVPGWRIGAMASFGDFQGDELSEALPNKFIEDNAVGFKVYGQYQFNNWIGIEAAYHNSGDFEDQSKNDSFPGKLDLSFTGFSVQGLVYIPVPAEDFHAYVKAGYYDFDDELSVDGSTNSTSSESGLVAGLGALIAINDSLGIRTDFDYFDNDLGDLWSVNLGVEYYFGGAKAEPAATAAPPPPPPAEPVAEPPPAAEAAAAEAAAEPAAPADSDGDGVTDDKDDCPSTSAGAQVNERGCEG